MKMFSIFSIFLLIFVLCAYESLQMPQNLQQQDRNSGQIFDYIPSEIEKSKSLLELESRLMKNSAKQEPSLLNYFDILHRKKRSSNDLLLDPENDLEDLLGPQPVQLPITIDLKTLPPVIRYLVEQKLKEQRSRMTPRLGRDIEDDDCQRPRPPFAPRLGKKSVPFKPRLGRRQNYDDTRC